MGTANSDVKLITFTFFSYVYVGCIIKVDLDPTKKVKGSILL